MVLEEPDIGSIDPNILIDNNWEDDELHFGMPWDSSNYEDEGDESDKQDAIPTVRQQQCATTELESFDVWTSVVDRYEGEDRNDADTDE